MDRNLIQPVIDRYASVLYHAAFTLLQNRQDAEDALQETLLRFITRAPDFHDEEHKKAWLIRVATNQCRDLLRFRNRHPQIDAEYLDNISCETTESGILEALAALPEKYRLVLTLYYVHECSTEEIARVIRRTPSAVKMRLQKGRKLLEKIYREEYL